jgi:CRISPR-associated protein Cst2
MNLKTQGFILIDVDVVALNNAGKSNTTNYDNGVVTKKIFKNGRGYTYVSGQAWRYWWRETLKDNHNWIMSPIIKVDGKNQTFTACNPIKFPDDDIFGYMKALKDLKRDGDGNPILNSKGKEETEDVSVTRISPLKNSVFVSVGSTSTVENPANMSRHEGNPVLYSKQEYSAIMKGMFSIDLNQAGTFYDYFKTGFKNLTESLKNEVLEQKLVIEFDDPFVKDKNGEAKKIVQLPQSVRVQRITDTLAALKTISGGAMQTNNMADVTPKFIVLTSMNSGNHPFSHIAKSEGMNNDKVLLNIEGIKEVLNDYNEQFQGTVFIGKRSGFMDEYNEELKALETEFPNVKVLTVNQAIDQYCEQVKTQIV